MRGRHHPGAGLAVALLLAAGTATAAEGEQLYVTNCAVCHLADGAGSPGLAPPLRSALWKRLESRTPAYLAGVMVSGLVGVPLDGQVYGAAMPPWSQLSDAELAAIGSYVLQKLNGQRNGLAVAAVKQARDTATSYAALKALRDGGS